MSCSYRSESYLDAVCGRLEADDLVAGGSVGCDLPVRIRFSCGYVPGSIGAYVRHTHVSQNQRDMGHPFSVELLASFASALTASSVSICERWQSKKSGSGSACVTRWQFCSHFPVWLPRKPAFTSWSCLWPICIRIRVRKQMWFR